MIKAVISLKRTGLSPKVVKILKKYGSQTVNSIKIVRIPLSNMLQKTINTIVSNDEGMVMNHLCVIVNGGILMEKNSVINMDVNKPLPPNSESMNVSVTNNVTIDQLIENCRVYMGDAKFINYSGRDSNCQDWINALLTSNHMNTPQYQEFLKQDTKSMIGPNARKLMNTLTDLDAGIDVIKQGSGDLKPSKSKKIRTIFEIYNDSL